MHPERARVPRLARVRALRETAPKEAMSTCHIRCPLCVAVARSLLVGNAGPAQKRVIRVADLIVAGVTFKDWTARAEHLVTEHGWVARVDVADPPATP